MSSHSTPNLQARLQKNSPNPHHARAVSTNFQTQPQLSPPLSAQGTALHPALAAERGTLLPPRPVGIGAELTPRPDSPEWTSRPDTPRSDNSRPQTPVPPIRVHQSATTTSLAPTLAPVEDEKKKRRKSWFGRSKSKDDQDRGPAAWIVGHQSKVPYDLNVLLGANAVQELWDAGGDCLVYLFPRTSGKGPSFRVDSSVFASSPFLTKLAFGDLYSSPDIVAGADRRDVPLEATAQALSLNDPSTPPITPERVGRRVVSTSSGGSRGSRSIADSLDDTRPEVHLYLPIKLSTDSGQLSTASNDAKASPEDIETLVAVRNLFAFLMGQSLVATERRSSLFSIFMRLSELLKLYEFSNLDDSTFGEVAATSFDNYVEELGLDDVRASREKTIEGVVLGERMRSVRLYNEAFTHAVGKHDDITKLNSGKFRLLSPLTINRLGRAALDLEKRTDSVRHTLEDFDFPMIFSGIMNSKTADERKSVNFDAWRDSFFSMRKSFMAFQRHRYGSWPPKASSKKNNLETSGLNRLVLLDLYHDLSSMYDLLVDRKSLTNRTADGVLIDDRDIDAPVVRALRAVLSEYDRSSPPVKPPVPFDLPTLPDLRTTRSDYGTGDHKKDAKALSKKLKDDEIAQLLRASYNQDTIVTPFVNAFREMERKAARGCTIQDICDLRVGQWIFMYAVLQSLPLLVMDAPGLKYTKGVEYFLCEPPRSGVPWAREDSMGKKWYGIQGGGVVSLPSDVIEHSVDAVYRRSHCWTVAHQWAAGDPVVHEAIEEQSKIHEPLTPPPPLVGGGSAPGSRSSSPSRSKRESVMMLGLEALPLPAGVRPDGGLGGGIRQTPRLPSHRDVSKTFDAILADTDQGKGKKRK